MWTLRTYCLRVPREGGSLSLSTICLLKRCHRSSEFGDGIDVNAFGGVSCSDEDSQRGKHSFGYFCLSINQSVKIYIAPLQDTYSEALPTQAKRKRRVFRRWWN